jgi:hypothetical protein
LINAFHSRVHPVQKGRYQEIHRATQQFATRLKERHEKAADDIEIDHAEDAESTLVHWQLALTHISATKPIVGSLLIMSQCLKRNFNDSVRRPASRVRFSSAQYPFAEAAASVKGI